jgi:hypothetical protein
VVVVVVVPVPVAVVVVVVPVPLVSCVQAARRSDVAGIPSKATWKRR